MVRGEFRVSGFGSRASGLGFRVSGLGSRVSVFGSRVSGFGSRVSGFGFRVSGLGFRVSGFGIGRYAELVVLEDDNLPLDEQPVHHVRQLKDQLRSSCRFTTRVLSHC